MVHSCDFSACPKGPGEHSADQVAELRLDSTTFRMDVCEEGKAALTQMMLKAGFTPSSAQVGHNRRGAYVTKSGRTFTTREARAWLQAHGIEVAEAGRLTSDQLARYAQSH